MAGEDKILKKEQFEKYNLDLKAKLRWVGTRADYDALVTKDPYTTYYITDEEKIIRDSITYSDMGKFLPLTGGILSGDLMILKTEPTVTLQGSSDIIQQTTSADLGKNHFKMNATGIEIVSGIEGMKGAAVKVNRDGTVLINANNGANTVGLMKMGTDGSLKFNNSDIITQTMLDAFFDRIYPVGITFVQHTDADNPNTLFPGTTWNDITNTIVSSGCRYPAFSSATVGTKLDQELPNIKGWVTDGLDGWYLDNAYSNRHSGALCNELDNSTPASATRITEGSTTLNRLRKLHFNANKSNSIYKDDANVQPFTYTVKLWQRIA